MKKVTVLHVAIIALGLVTLQAGVLTLLGQPLISASGNIQFWVSEALSSEMSQQLFDWYTFSHIIHGFLFYALLRWLFPRMPMATRLLVAMGIEIGWEIAENTPWVINAYREQALAQGYSGDSIINSVLDTFSMMLGFFMAFRVPIWFTVTLALAFEVFTGYVIHDNLTLNITNFIYQPEFIYRWQSGG
ncbi:MAG: DUF2585 family protein [Patescibacteria group bacterium]|nr:DUF2585 family protein [Patescibacteria group bacterium]